jgi:hypothetical protein
MPPATGGHRCFVYLDMTPKGRNETEIMDWVKRNDEYEKDARTIVLLTRCKAYEN